MKIPLYLERCFSRPRDAPDARIRPYRSKTIREGESAMRVRTRPRGVFATGEGLSGSRGAAADPEGDEGTAPAPPDVEERYPYIGRRSRRAVQPRATR